jgi:hypothetical protein
VIYTGEGIARKKFRGISLWKDIAHRGLSVGGLGMHTVIPNSSIRRVAGTPAALLFLLSPAPFIPYLFCNYSVDPIIYLFLGNKFCDFCDLTEIYAVFRMNLGKNSDMTE